MTCYSLNVLELRLEQDGVLACVSWPAPALQPGQYLLGFAAGSDEPLATPLFPAGAPQAERLWLAPPAPPAWTVGTALQVRAPLGSGFRLPPTAGRVACVAWQCGPWRLMPLLTQALAQRAAVALYTPFLPAGLPAAVEVLPLEALDELQGWADYLALDLEYAALPAVRRALGLGREQRLACPAQALLRTPILCGGPAECGVCAVRTAAGWQLACKDGPVFDWSVLREE